MALNRDIDRQLDDPRETPSGVTFGKIGFHKNTSRSAGVFFCPDGIRFDHNTNTGTPWAAAGESPNRLLKAYGALLVGLSAGGALGVPCQRGRRDRVGLWTKKNASRPAGVFMESDFSKALRS